MAQQNPFAIVKAADYTDEEINSLWVDIGRGAIDHIIEPLAKTSKFILGGKGTGKTHLLRYFSYPVIRLRKQNLSGLEILKQEKFLAVFLRATGLDASRFGIPTRSLANAGQQLFGTYFELRLVESLLHALCDIKETSKNEVFDDKAFVKYMGSYITAKSFADVESLESFNDWIINERKTIDEQVNNAAFTGKLDVHIAFSIGALCIPISKALQKLNSAFMDIPVIYLIDEVENLPASQQQVINSLIRYAEQQATFRVAGRLYALKTLATLSDGEENRAGSEFKVFNLDCFLRDYSKFPEFARKFIKKRLAAGGLGKEEHNVNYDPSTLFEEVDNSYFYKNPIATLGFNEGRPEFLNTYIKNLQEGFEERNLTKKDAGEIVHLLTSPESFLLKKLNFLMFAKKIKKSYDFKQLKSLAEEIKANSETFIKSQLPKSYKTAYDHYANDLFAQLCRESNKEQNVPYAGFENFVKISSGNPRNLLIALEKAYSIALFREIDFTKKSKLSVELQTSAMIEAAHFLFEVDTNFGTQTEDARVVTDRLATLLRTARYALNIPEVSPLVFSFDDHDLSNTSRETLTLALNYSFLFEIQDGRPDRNSQKLNRKIQLNPLLAPRWGLPIGRRGDLSFNRELLNSIFDISQTNEFKHLLKGLEYRWNNPFKLKVINEFHQDKLFN